MTCEVKVIMFSHGVYMTCEVKVIMFLPCVFFVFFS